MNLMVQGHNMDVTDFVRDYVDKKIGRLGRYLPNLREARVDIREQQSRSNDHRYVVQVTLHDTRGTILRGEERDGEILAAVDTVFDKMHRQIVRYKGKRKDRYHRQGSDENWGQESPIELEDEEESQEIVRTKRFAMSPMNAEEAIEQMELLGHTFFVYYDVDYSTINVVYRRRDGNYGLIIPELA